MERENGIKKFHEIVYNTSGEREKEDREQLLKQVLFRSIFASAQHIICMDGKFRRKRSLSGWFPTELTSFPELRRVDLSSNERFSEAKSILGIDWKHWREEVSILRRKIVNIPETTVLSITTGISPDKVCSYTIPYIYKDVLPKEIHYFPSISRNKRSRDEVRTRTPEEADFLSFKNALDFVMRKVDPEYLPKLEEQVLYAD